MAIRGNNYASTIVLDCLKLQPGEEVIIFSDKNNLHIADDLSEIIHKYGGKLSIFYISDALRPLEKINDVQSISLVSADAVIYVLDIDSKKFDLSREVEFRHYLFALPIQYKGRVCMMPGFSNEMKNAVMIDYQHLNKKCQFLKELIKDKHIRIETDLGTDIEFSLLGREIEIDNGDISRPGLFGNIPAGEIFSAPIEESINGKLVIDGSVGDFGTVKSPFSIELRAGQIRDMVPMVKDDVVFNKFSDICEMDVPATKTVGEFGIGLNPRAKIVGNMLLDEKVEGTIHFAFGDSYSLGKSSSKFHTDLLIKNPSIFAGNKCIMEKGKFITNV